jgi:hypothetical protein
MAEGFLASLGALVRDVRTPDGFLRYIALVLFVVGVVKGPFNLDNQMMTWGITCAVSSFAWSYLEKSTGVTYDMHSGSHRYVEWSWLIIGLGFLGIAAVLFYHNVTNVWLLPVWLQKLFPLRQSDVRV